MNALKVISSLTLLLVLISCGNSYDGETIEAQGTIEATNVLVSSKVNGEILSVLKDEGDYITAGDTVMLIDREIYELQLAAALAVMQGAEAQYLLLKTGAREEDINQSEELLKQAEINFELANKDFKRMKNLYESKAITQKQFDDAKARYDVSQAQLRSAKENFSKISNYARPEELKQAEANLNRAIANVNLIKKSIRECYVTSPISGFIVKTFIEEGETATAMSSLFYVSDLSKIEMTIYISETELAKVKLNQQAEITTDTYPDKNYEGRVSYISPEAEFTPKNIQTKEERTKLVFAVKIKIGNNDFELKDGMPADAVIYL
ncbi:MAG: efflux RND transporter periplasmic adaptor subunit [Ignavibacteria bacterium]|jgi:HlyD family secretion protein